MPTASIILILTNYQSLENEVASDPMGVQGTFILLAMVLCIATANASLNSPVLSALSAQKAAKTDMTTPAGGSENFDIVFRWQALAAWA